VPISGPLFYRRNDFVCNTNIRRCGMKSFERGFRRSAFETCFEGVELQGKGRQRQLKIRQLFYARISIHGLQGSRQNGEFGQLCTSVRQYRDRTTRVDLLALASTASTDRPISLAISRDVIPDSARDRSRPRCRKRYSQRVIDSARACGARGGNLILDKAKHFGMRLGPVGPPAGSILGDGPRKI
jgi:hypothetical protein